MIDDKQNIGETTRQGVDAIRADCYKCIYRGSVPGDAHSCCNHPGNKTGMFENQKKLNIKASSHGVKKGWFMWPVNFDPVWLENCDGFSLKP